MSRGLSLANKCQLLFGLAVVLIITAVLVVPWMQSRTSVDQSQLENSRQIARLYASNMIVDPRWASLVQTPEQQRRLERDLVIVYYEPEEWATRPRPNEFEERAARAFETEATRTEFFESVAESAATPILSPDETPASATLGADDVDEDAPESGNRVEAPGTDAPSMAQERVPLARQYRYAARLQTPEGEDQGVLIVRRRSEVAAGQVFVNRVYLILAGFGGILFAILVFYFIVTRLILQPVRTLKATADTVRAGNLHVRSEIRTGDEFEQLADAFNDMLTAIAAQQSQLRSVNRSLDLKLTELAERNVSLYEAARVKGEFLANVSHELRTPLNSIIGFAEILQEIAERDLEQDASPPDHNSLLRRKRYLENIVGAGRTLLEMIEELLTMARIEAGNIELHVAPMNVAETCEGLLALIRPLAERKNLDLDLRLPTSGSPLPMVHTDAKKLQQIVFNFLSNAVKFTPEGGRVMLRADLPTDASGEQRLRLSVIDTGPGIPRDKHHLVFQKFSQLDASHTKRHQGTGLGLAIAEEFAEMLRGEVVLDSDAGRGAMFSVVIPLTIEPPPPAEPERPAPNAASQQSLPPAPTAFS
jgi:two-component system, NarL family, sensor histidine kinase BarA